MVGFQTITDGVSLLKVPFGGVFTGIVLVRGKKNYLIDSGGNADGIDRVLLPALSEAGLSLRDIDGILNTHTHGDHIGGHRRICELAPHIRVITQEKSAPKLREPLVPHTAIRAVFPSDSPAPSKELRGVEPSEIVSDGEILDGELMFLHTPGHDDDSGCWFHLPTRTLIAGDSLQMNGTPAQGIGLYNDLPAYRETLRKLMELRPDNIVAGHGYLPLGAVALGRDASDAYLRLCADTVSDYDRFIREKVAEGDDMRQIARALCRHVGNPVPEYLFLPLFTVREHLREIGV